MMAQERYPEARARLMAEGAGGDPPRPAGPARLTLADLHEVPEVFQTRHELVSMTRFPDTVARLCRLIRDGTTLDAMTVWWSGARWIVLEGHHRSEAYRQDAERQGIALADYAVPVAAFTGTLDEAEKEAGRDNFKVRNATSDTERQERAWKLMVSGSETSPTAIAKATGISRTQADRMRKKKAELLAQGMTSDDMLDQGWWRCVKIKEGKTMLDPEDVEAFKAQMEKTADRLFKALDKEFGGTWHRQAQAFAHGLATIAPQFAKMLVDTEALWPMVQEVQRVERDAEAEERAELADRVRRNRPTPDDIF